MTTEIIVTTLLLLAGLALVIIGSEVLVDGSSTVARKLGISEFVIGLSIVALGTSAPEMVVSFVGAIQGKADISIGNVLGSNIFNTAFVLGLSAMIAPVLITGTNRRRDIPFNLVVTLLLLLMGSTALVCVYLPFAKDWNVSNQLTWIDGLIFLAAFIAYMILSFVSSESTEEEVEKPKTCSLGYAILFIIGGIAALVFGGKVFVSNAEKIAEMAGLSDKFIAITVLACGTSLPELVTSIVAARKGRGQMALGNVLGSNVANILLVVGGSAVISAKKPLDLSNINLIDYSALGALSILLIICSFISKKKVSRFEGFLLLLVGVAYMTYLIMTI